MSDPAAFWRMLAATQGATLALIVLFLALPEIDLAVSAMFFDPARGFFLARSPVAPALRDAFRLAFDAALATLVLLGRALLRRGAAAGAPRHWGFLAAGPGLGANVVLKAHWGRARPEAVTPFGGTEAFAPPFLLTDACARNCSFVSGEAAAWA